MKRSKYMQSLKRDRLSSILCYKHYTSKPRFLFTIMAKLHPMELTVRCDIAWIQTRDCQLLHWEIQCLRPLRHSGVQHHKTFWNACKIDQTDQVRVRSVREVKHSSLVVTFLKSKGTTLIQANVLSSWTCYYSNLVKYLSKNTLK